MERLKEQFYLEVYVGGQWDLYASNLEVEEAIRLNEELGRRGYLAQMRIMEEPRVDEEGRREL